MFGGIGFQEMLIIGIIAVLLFGSKLPDVAKTVGASYKEFRDGLFNLQSTMNSSIDSPSSRSRKSSSTPREEYDDYEEASAPMFKPPVSEPTSDDE